MAVDTDRLRALLSAATRQAEPIATNYRAIAASNESFFLGDQRGYASLENGKLVAKDTAWFDGVPYLKINLLTNAVQTWTSLIAQERPSVKAYPASASLDDVFSAQVANDVIAYTREDLDETENIHQMVRLGLTHGTSAMRIIYDQASNCVKWAPVTVHDYLIDPKYPNYQDARYVIFYRYIDEMEAIDLLGLDPDSDETEAQIAQLMCTYRNQAGEQLRGIRLTEFWHRGATLKYPKGFYASFIGDAVAQFFPEYPYQLRYKSGDYNPLPVVVFKAISQIDSAYGVTQLSDATKLQRQLNETVSRIMQISRQTSTAHLILPKNIADQWVADTDETHIIGVSTNELQYATNIRYTELPNVPSALLDQRIYFEQKLYDVLGINEATAGTDQRLRSGRALDRIQTLDKMKNAGAAKNLSRAITDAWRLTLALIQHYYSEAKTITLANTNMPRTLAFTGADLLGADIRLEESSSIDQLEISKQLAAREDLAAGFISKPEFEALTYSDNAAAVNDLIAQYLEGYRVEINTDLLDPNHVASAVKRLQNEAIASGSKDLWVKLEQLRQKLSASVAASEAATADVATEQG